MAQSRLNKLASIFTRLNGLLKSNVMPWAERPLWYDIYKKFPPQRDPTYRAIAALSPQEYPPLPPKIFYEEDKIRAFYFKELGPIENQVLNSNLRKPIWDIFIDVYAELDKKGVEKKKLIEATCDEMLIRGYVVQSIKKHFAGKNESSQRNDSAKEFQDKLKSLIQNLETKKSPDATEKPAST